MRNVLVIALLVSLTGLFPALAQSAPTIADIVAEDAQFSTLLAALQQAELVETLAGEGPFTVFAPTDDAFAALPPGMLQGVMSSPPSLNAVLTYHVVPGVFMAADLSDGDRLPTVLGAPLTVSINADGVFINETVQVVTTDIEASNGVIHVISGVLVPARPGQAPAEAEEPGGQTLLDVIQATDNLAFLATALSLAEPIAAVLAHDSQDATETLPMLFAPNDEAFTALDQATRNAAIADPALLMSILLYHMVPEGTLFDDMVLAGMAELNEPLEVETALPGATLTLALNEDGAVVVNDAIVVEANIEASNGYLHIIDAVLIPPDDAILSPEDLEQLLSQMEEAEAEGTGSASDAPALDPNWAAVAGGFRMAELDSADDFFVTVIDPFTNDELYGIEIINWTANYQYTGFIVAQYLPAEVLIWMNEQDPRTFELIAPSVLAKLPAEELAKLPEEVRARAAQ